MEQLFNPRAVAIVGASATPGKIGYALVKNMLASGYRGRIYPVNPKAKEIAGLRCYPAVEEIEDEIDLAVIAVPAAAVTAVAEACGRRGVKFLVVISAGFKETGLEGLKREKDLTAICRRYNMRLVGPNCVGIMDTHTPLNASFSAIFPPRGHIAFISQSGAMMVAILDWSRQSGVGFSRVVSIGNKADLNEADYIRAAALDDSTRVILCYIEDVADGKEFLEAAREAVKRKPVVILKSGVSQAGARAASSHTGALAGSDIAFDTAFRQAGVIRARTMAELFDLAIAFAVQPLPRTESVAVVTNAGGPGIVATDSIELNGLQVARFQKETVDFLRQKLPVEASVYNPVDVLGDAGPERFHLALDKVLADENVASAVVLVCPTAVTDPVGTARAVIDVHRSRPHKPVFAVYMGGETMAPGVEMLARENIPCYTFPETAIKAIRGMVSYAKVRKRLLAPQEEPPSFSREQAKAEAIFARVRAERRLNLLGSEAAVLLAAYGINVAPTILAATPKDACRAAEEVGFPVVMKIAAPQIIHKTDVGGVRIGLKTAQEVEAAFAAIMASVQRLLPGTEIYGVEIQPLKPKGHELIIGVTRDVQFGHLIAFGLGGIYVNLLKDVAFRLTRGLTRSEVERMITETKAYTLLRGYRGEKAADIPALVDTILRVARLVEDFPFITEMDINPLFAYPEGVVAVDIKITIEGEGS